MILRFPDNVMQICLIYWSISLGFRYSDNCLIKLFPDCLLFLLLTLFFVCLEQRDNVRNQREHLVLTLSNAQSQLSIPGQNDPVSSSF